MKGPERESMILRGYAAGDAWINPYGRPRHKMSGGGERWYEEQTMAVGLLGCNTPITVAPFSHRTKGGWWQDALRHRVARTMGVEEISDATLAQMRASMREFIKVLPDPSGFVPTAMFDEETFEAVLATRDGYTVARKDELRRAFYRARERGSWSRTVKTFIKREFYPEPKPPRAINARCDEFKAVCLANWQMLGHYIFKNVSNFTKTIPECDRPAYIEERLGSYPVKFVTDYSRFESTFRSDLLQLEFMIYDHYGLPSWCWETLAGRNQITGETGRAVIVGKRMSGELNTSLGNSLMNFFFVFHVMRNMGLRYGTDWDGVFEGDDGLIGATRLPTVEMFEEIGCNIDIDEIPDFGRGGYCGLFYGEDLAPVVSPYTILISLWSLTCPADAGETLRRELLNGKLLGLLHRAPGCPIAHAVQRMYMAGNFRVKRSYWASILFKRFGMQSSTQGGYWMTGSAAAVVPPPTESVRLTYEEVFGVTVKEQIACEEEIMGGNWNMFGEICSKFNPALVQGALFLDRR